MVRARTCGLGGRILRRRIAQKTNRGPEGKPGLTQGGGYGACAPLLLNEQASEGGEAFELALVIIGSAF